MADKPDTKKPTALRVLKRDDNADASAAKRAKESTSQAASMNLVAAILGFKEKTTHSTAPATAEQELAATPPPSQIASLASLSTPVKRSALSILGDESTASDSDQVKAFAPRTDRPPPRT